MTPCRVVLMGVSGSGKSTVGAALAARLGWPFQDADDLQPAANIARMAAGQALSDADREPWLDAVRAWLERQAPPAVLAASLLKRVYRERVFAGLEGIRLVWLTAPAGLLAARIAGRADHFFPPALLPSQLAIIEPPEPAECAVAIDGRGSVAETVGLVLAALGP